MALPLVDDVEFWAETRARRERVAVMPGKKCIVVLAGRCWVAKAIRRATVVRE